MKKGKYQDWITDEGLTLIQGWARDGLTYQQIADNIGINNDTLFEWRKRFPQISDALKQGREVIDRHVENALYQRATGFKYKEQVVTNKGDIVEVERYEPPNPTSIIFWLKNRKPEQWREKSEQKIDMTNHVTIIEDLDE